ncbi:MAG: YjbQ family protein [Deltaproteobacteria bacterium]|nr:YjbQ family protein [Deltaproteobacteria bacterium]
MIFLKSYFVNTTPEIDFLSIMADVKYAIRDAQAKNGLVSVHIPGPAAAVTVFEPLPELIEELKIAFETFASEAAQGKDKRKEEVFIAPRVQAALIGRSLSMPLKGGSVLIAPYEEIFLIDFDKKSGRREYYVSIVAEDQAPPPKQQQQQQRKK